MRTLPARSMTKSRSNSSDAWVTYMGAENAPTSSSWIVVSPVDWSGAPELMECAAEMTAQVSAQVNRVRDGIGWFSLLRCRVLMRDRVLQVRSFFSGLLWEEGTGVYAFSRRSLVVTFGERRSFRVSDESHRYAWIWRSCCVILGRLQPGVRPISSAGTRDVGYTLRIVITGGECCVFGTGDAMSRRSPSAPAKACCNTRAAPTDPDHMPRPCRSNRAATATTSTSASAPCPIEHQPPTRPVV